MKDKVLSAEAGLDMSCKDCKYSCPRDKFSFKKYGSYYATYECFFDTKKEKYVRLDDNCEHFEERRINNG